jgi:hypothetical protein
MKQKKKKKKETSPVLGNQLYKSILLMWKRDRKDRYPRVEKKKRLISESY